MKSAREKLDQSIQRDILFDFKKVILCYLGLGAIFLFLSLATFFASGEIKNILLILLVLFSIVMVVSGCVIASKIKCKEEKYKKLGKAVIRKSEEIN